MGLFNQKGFAPIIVFIVIVVIVGVSALAFKNSGNNIHSPSPTTNPIEASPSATASATPTPTPKAVKTAAPTAKVTKIPVPAKTAAPAATATPTPPPPPPAPTPTAVKKPICSLSFIMSNQGTAPFQASVCVGNNSDPYQTFDNEKVDYQGDGSWDYDGTHFGCHPTTYTTPGTYTARAIVRNNTTGDSEPCTATVVVN
jgi:hypothetical protein